ncbi:serine/threonine-protein kinase [Actinomadura sp. NPDC048394]|uniref:serine/threonine-protein kinase n=1 Tax=Actinomadura sp. NPDC048394 TaxID=3158223 RepID=UPI0034054B22
MSAMPLKAGDPTHVGSWELEGRLGEGGQGVVYLGRGPGGERVAVKVLRGLDDEALRRLGREVETAGRVARFCTVRILDVRLDPAPAYVVSEYVDGPSLQDAVKAEGPRRGAALERLAIDTATALAAVHAAGVVHRDFKPHNVLLGPDGPRVIDFGIARDLDVTSSLTGGPIGTPAYMAPEQIEGRPATAAADVFAWGATMVFAATGHPAFARDSVPALFHQILSEDADLSGLDGWLRDLVASCLAKDPDERPTAAEVISRLTARTAWQPVDTLPAAASPAPPPPPPPAASTLPPVAASADPAFASVPPPPAAPPPAALPQAPGIAGTVPQQAPWTAPPGWPQQARPAGGKRRRVWPWLVVGITLPVVAAMVAGGIIVARQVMRHEDASAVSSLPADVCSIYDSSAGKRVLADMGAAKGKRIPRDNADQYGEWKLCAFGTNLFPPTDTFQIQLNLYNRDDPRKGIDDARNALHGGTNFGCSGTPGTGTGVGEESCEGLTNSSWAEVVARKGNVIATASCSAQSINDRYRGALRRAAQLALDKAL